jgi:hypothetical protein
VLEYQSLSSCLMGQKTIISTHMSEYRTWPELQRLRSSVSFMAKAVLLFIVCLMVGAATAGHYQLAVVALFWIVTVTVFAYVRPTFVFMALITMLLVPYTWSPMFNNAPLPAIMLLALPAGLAGAAFLIQTGRLQLCILDYLVLAIFMSAVLSEVASGGSVFGSSALAHNEVVVILLPYVAFRAILTAWPVILSRLPAALTFTGVGLSFLAIWEEITRANLFTHSALNNPALAQWAVAYPRAGGVRADATMGHPIALGSFLVIPLLIAFAQRRWVTFAIIAVGEALTLSRGPYIAAIIALILYSALTHRLRRLWLIAALVGSLALFIGPVRGSVSNSFESGSNEQSSADYRSKLLGTSLHSVTVWGKPGGETSELFANSGVSRLHDITSEFALLAGRQGIVGLCIWVLFLAAVIYVIIEAQRRKDLLLLLLGVGLVSEWIALLSVALITSLQYVFWLLIATTAVRLTQARGLNNQSSTRYRGGGGSVPRLAAEDPCRLT